jgi:hypothetical protein
LADLYQLDTFQVQYAQQTSPQCKEVWIMQQAIELKNMQEGPYPEQIPSTLPTWLSDEVARQEANPVDPEEVLRALEECQVCNPDGIAGGGVVVPGGGGGGDASEPASEEPTAVPAPAPTEVPVPAPFPVIAPLPVPVPAPAPVPAPVMAPAPAPEVVVPVSSPPPAPVVVPVSAGIIAASFKSVGTVVVSALAMLFLLN